MKWPRLSRLSVPPSLTPMDLHTTLTSPFGLMVRILILEKGLTDRITVIPAKTRTIDSPYYQINPSGRVPYLILDDGTGMEESQLICAYLDHLDGAPRFDHPAGPEGWESRRLESLARSMLDGISVWSRELKRAPDEQSPTIIAHEIARAKRMVETWEHHVTHPVMTGDFNMAQLTLAVTLNIEHRMDGFTFRGTHPNLTAWSGRLAARPSLRELLPHLGG